jgi:hypothetical protein
MLALLHMPSPGGDSFDVGCICDGKANREESGWQMGKDATAGQAKP